MGTGAPEVAYSRGDAYIQDIPDCKTVADAAHIGYADYCLSRKCKAETGFSINNYIKIVKVEKAKTLLLSTDMSIRDICDRLHFGSRSFFAETFKEITGIPPAAYWEQNMR